MLQWYVQVVDGMAVGTPTRHLACPDGFYPCNWGEYDPQQHHIAGSVFDGQRVTYTICAWPYGRSLDEARRLKVEEIQRSYISALARGYTCSSTITMDAFPENIALLKMGLELAQREGATAMYLVDYYNAKLDDVPVSTVDAMLLELGENLRSQHEKKNTLRMQVMAAQTVEEVGAVVW